MQGLVESAWVLPVLAQGALALRVALDRSSRKHVFLLGLASTLIAVEVVLNVGHGLMSRIAYFHFWIASYLSVTSLIPLALIEACTRSLSGYDKFGEAGQRIIRFILLASGLSILTLSIALPDAFAERFLAYLEGQTYLVQGSLALLGAAVLGFAAWARLVLSPNARMTMIVLTLLCAMDGILASSISAEWGSFQFLLGMAWSTGCWSFLALRWSNSPEATRVRPKFSAPVDVAPALARMDAVNRQLGELVRRG